MSQLAPLVQKLKQSGAERVYFLPNEDGYSIEGALKRPIPGGPVHGATILQAVSEILSNDDIQELSTTRPRIVRHEHEGEEFVFEVIRQANGVALGIRAPAAPATRGGAARSPGRSNRGSVDEPAPARTPRGSVDEPRRPDALELDMGRGAAAPAQRPLTRAEAQRLDEEYPVRPTIREHENGPEPPRGARQQEPAPAPQRPAPSYDAAPEPPRGARPYEAPAPAQAPAPAADGWNAATAAQMMREMREIARDAARDAAHEVVREALRDLPRAAAAPAAAGEVVPRRKAAAAPLRTTPAKIDGFLREMIQRKASDLHLTSNAHPVLRVDGEIHFGEDRPVATSQEILEMLYEIMTPRAREEFDNTNDADFAYEIPGLARFRVNAFQDRQGTGAVLRQIPIEVLTAEKLGLPKACLDLCWLSKGLVLVTGPTGSGKSTTLAAMIDFINKNRSDHIITIEDPVEFVHKNQKCLVNQREVGMHTNGFKHALRAALREDPDIVLVGEMRDLETIAIAIETAETGHLVFGTLHTTTAISTVDRIIDQFPSDRQEQIRVMLSESLKGVVAQILCPKVGGGRVAAHEILLGNHAVAALIREGKTFQMASVMQTSKGQGMITMNDSLMNLVQKKLVDPKQAYIKAVDKNGFAAMLKGAGIALQI